jgi:hypothetical protein
MIRHIENNDHFATKCAGCGQTLTNPGYHQQYRYCCGKYRRWYDSAIVQWDFDDGRDERGRFHHNAHVVYGTYQRTIFVKGGD